MSAPINELRFTDVAAERHALGSIMAGPEMFAAGAVLNADCFSSEQTALVFQAIVAVNSRSHPVNPMTVGRELIATGAIDAVGGMAVLSSFDSTCSTVVLEHEVGRLLDLALKRKALRVTQEAAELGDADDPMKAFDEVLAKMKRFDAEMKGANGQQQLTSLMDISAGEPDPRATVLGNRFLCINGALLFIGPSGIGKSSASAQQDQLWGLGREAFGIRPSRPLKILTIQAENDAQDIAEMRDGVCKGLGLTEAERQQVRANVFYETECGRTGADFLAYVDSRLSRARFDLLRIDPLLAYLGADATKPDETARFLRNGLNPILAKHQVAAILNHHTPKVTNRDTSTWRASDWMYAGAGSHDITNWARAILVIDPTHAPHVFRFHAAKRGSRIGWVDDCGQRETTRLFCHASDGLYWREATQEDANQVADATTAAKTGKARKCKEDLLALVPVVESISKNALLAKAQGAGIGLNLARGFVSELIADGVIQPIQKSRSGTRPEEHLSRCSR